MKLFDLSGRRVLITGASRGIGLAIADGMARCGAAVAITGRKLDTLNIAAEQLRTSGAAVSPFTCNQGQAADIDELFRCLDEQGFVADVAVINAATNPIMSPLIDTEPSAWQKILDVNLTGAWLTARQAARRMLANGKGSIVVITSVAGFDPIPGLGAYSVSKTGLIGLTKALARELAPRGVRVNAIAPGLIETRFSTALFQDKQQYESWMAQVPMGRHGQPEDIVGAAVFLAADASSYMTGQVMVIDGGGRM